MRLAGRASRRSSSPRCTTRSRATRGSTASIGRNGGKPSVSGMPRTCGTPTHSASSRCCGVEAVFDQADRVPAVLAAVVERRGREPDHVGLAPVAGEPAREQRIEQRLAVDARAPQSYGELRAAPLRLARRQDLDAIAEALVEHALE